MFGILGRQVFLAASRFLSDDEGRNIAFTLIFSDRGSIGYLWVPLGSISFLGVRLCSPRFLGFYNVFKLGY